MKPLIYKDSWPVADPASQTRFGPAAPRDEGAWRVLPIEGAFEFSYSDAAGNPSLRRVIAQELKLGPGKTLLGGIDLGTEGYRGFRADRIHVLEDAETGEVIDRNILDWLHERALRQERALRRAKAALARRANARRRADGDALVDRLDGI